MFKKKRLRYHGYETYGKIIEIKDIPVGLNTGYICIKRLTVLYNVNNQSYEVTQEIYKVVPKHKKVMIVGNFIRILVNENYLEFISKMGAIVKLFNGLRISKNLFFII